MKYKVRIPKQIELTLVISRLLRKGYTKKSFVVNQSDGLIIDTKDKVFEIIDAESVINFEELDGIFILPCEIDENVFGYTTTGLIEKYNEIARILRSNPEIDIGVYPEHVEKMSGYHKFKLELENKYGLEVPLQNINNYDWIRWVGCNVKGIECTIGLWGEKHRRTLGVAVNGKQPDDELLFSMGIPTGVYIFVDNVWGDGEMCYKLFNEFFEELKEQTNPKYVDNVNSRLLYALEDAKQAIEVAEEIYEKYKTVYTKTKDEIRIAELEKQVAELKAKTNG